MRDRALEVLSEQFPERLEVARNFGVLMEGPIPLELLVEALARSQQLEIEGAIELQQQWLETVLKSFRCLC